MSKKRLMIIVAAVIVGFAVVVIISLLKNGAEEKQESTATLENGSSSSKYVILEPGENNKDGIEGSVAKAKTNDKPASSSSTAKPTLTPKISSGGDSVASTPQPSLSPEERWKKLKPDNDNEDDESKHIPDEVRKYDLYDDFLFGVTDNKTYKEDKTIPEIDENLQMARDFVKTFVNISYKDINTKEKYDKRRDKILHYFENGSTWRTNGKEYLGAKEYVETWLNLVKSTKSIIKASFYTDRNLIYGHPSTIVRGTFQYKVTACSAPNKLREFTCLLVSKTDDNPEKEKPVKISKSYYSAVEFTFSSTLSTGEWETGDSTLQYYSILGQVKEGEV